MSTWNKKNFSIYTSDERSALGLIEELGNQTNYNTEEIEKVKESDNKKVSHDEMNRIYKIDKNADFTGSWHGIKKPTASQEGLQATVDKIVEEDIPNINLQLDTNITDINKKINSISTSLTIRSVGIQLQNDSEMDYFINNFNDKLIKMKTLGITDVILCPVIYNRNTRVDLAFTFDKLVNCCNLVKNNGLKLTVKVHCWGDTFGETFDKILWFESYKNVLIRILNIGDIVRIGLMNETPFLTDNDNYKTNWLNLCNYIKTTYPNVELISSPTTSSEYNVLNHFCDYICFNFYPNDNVNKPIQPLGALLEGIYNYTDFDIEGKYKNPNYNKKKIFITECGIQPYEYSHLYPWNWDTNPNQAYSEDVQYNFYSDIIGYCESTDWIIGLSWWISGSSDNTWTFLNRKAENIIKEYWGGK